MIAELDSQSFLCLEERTLLFEQHLPLVGTVVHNLCGGRSIHPLVDIDDCYSLGRIGLWNATQSFEKNGGSKFKSYARVRIRGEIIDELRRIDYLTRNQRKTGVQYTIINLDSSDEDETGIHERLPDGRWVHPAIVADMHGFRQLLGKELEKLSPKEQMVIDLYFTKNLSQERVGIIVGLTAARVAQIIQIALKKLRNQLTKLD